MSSREPTPWRVICGGLMEGYSCGRVYLTEHEYDQMLSDASRPWRCPECGAEAEWDDDSEATR